MQFKVGDKVLPTDEWLEGTSRSEEYTTAGTVVRISNNKGSAIKAVVVDFPHKRQMHWNVNNLRLAFEAVVSDNEEKSALHNWLS